jgi:hypothetical protein
MPRPVTRGVRRHPGKGQTVITIFGRQFNARRVRWVVAILAFVTGYDSQAGAELTAYTALFTGLRILDEKTRQAQSNGPANGQGGNTR